MSYEKVKSIKIDKALNKVFINCASNNVRPLTYSNEEYTYFSDILKNQGITAVKIALLKSYEEGTLQEGNNIYTKALKVLRYVFKEEYKTFNWRNNNFPNDSDENKAYNERRNSQEFKDLLKKALDYKYPKDVFLITKDYFGDEIYAKVCPTCIKWSRFKDKATKFNFEEEARDHIYEKYKEEWKVIEWKKE